VPPTSTSGGESRKTGGRKTFALCAAIFTLAATFIVLFSHHGLYKIYFLRQEKVRLEKENAKLAEESARLARTIDRLRRDPEFIQDLIRRDLNFVKKNEIIIQLPGAEGVKASGEGIPPAQAGSLPKEQVGPVGPRPQAHNTPGPPRRSP
jgi:cell division protein FtsB